MHECSHRPPCPGCPRFGEAGIAEGAARRLAELADRSGARLEPLRAGRATGHRHRARLMVRGRAGAAKIGLFQADSHRIVDTPHCVVHHPAVNEAAGALKQAMRALRVAPYADAPHRGLVRALQVVVERASQRVQLTLVTRGDAPDEALPLLDALAEALGDRLHSLWWNGNPERTNVILGPHWERHAGPETVCETIAGARVFFPPGAFGQSHLALADEMVQAVHAQVPPGARVAELYAGCGAIGLGLLQRGESLAINELSPHGLRGLALGLAALPSEMAARASVHPGPAGEQGAWIHDHEVVIVDPPRKGLDARLCERLATTAPTRLIYLSCDLASLERDVATLTAGTRLKLASLEPYALFPFTEHVETLAVFDAASP